jgi:imidazolonepropionase-like amidohydrolase
MHLIRLISFVLAMGVAPCFAQTTAIKAGRVVDPQTGTAAMGQTILIEGGRIRAVGPAVPIPAGATILDWSAFTVLPGFIDAHVHLAIGGSVRDNALADLRAGFTTIVDLGARTHRLLRLRDSINAGHIAGPRVLAAGIWVGRKDGVRRDRGGGRDGRVPAPRARERPGRRRRHQAVRDRLAR